jgi:hypothetical protein
MKEDRIPNSDEASSRVEATKLLFDAHDTMSLAVSDAGEPWAAVVYFVDDEPSPGSLDMCCSILMSPQRRALFQTRPRVAFVVAGTEPDRWFQGVGSAEIVTDEADANAIVKRLADKAADAGPFLDRVGATPVRIHVDRLKVTDLDAEPPVTEFTFA